MPSLIRLKFILPVLLACGLPCVWLAAAKVEYTDAEASGTGQTEALAIQAALKECVGQVCGLSIAAETKLNIVEATLSTNNKDGYKASQKLQQRIETATKGRVASFKVLSVNKKTRAGVEARVAAKIARYVDPQNNRLRLAFMPFRPAQKHFMSDGRPLPGAAVAAQMVQALVQNIVSTRKFMVLDREYVDEISGEQQLIASASASNDDLCKLGAILGADYIVVGTLDDLHTEVETIPVPYTRQTMTRRSGGISVSLRVLDIATSQIKLADGVNMKNWIGDGVQSASVDLCGQAAASCSLKITEAIYPMRVIAVEHGVVVLNQGGDMVRAGDRYELFALGRELKDPVTGESLGRMERKCGVIEIVRSKPKMSEAKVMEGRENLAKTLEEQTILCRLLP
jgi:curli biogenesis system outer membrane secretion channel CsgG